MKGRIAAIIYTMLIVFAVFALGLFVLHFAEKRAGGNIIGTAASAVERAVTPGA